MAALTPQSVLATLAQVDHDCPFADAERIADVVNARAGDVQRAVDDCEGKPVFGRMLAYAEALEEIANPARLAARLSFEASCDHERAARFRREADEWRKRAARTGNGDHAELAAAREQTAIRYQKAANAKKARADKVAARLTAEAV